MNTVEPECRAHGSEFGDKARHLPQRRVVRALGAPTAELVVEHDRSLVGQGADIFQIVMWRAGAAVQHQQGNAGRIHAEHAVPDASAGDDDQAFFAVGGVRRGHGISRDER